MRKAKEATNGQVIIENVTSRIHFLKKIPCPLDTTSKLCHGMLACLAIRIQSVQLGEGGLRNIDEVDLRPSDVNGEGG